MNQPDPAEIEAIAARAEAATPGPWIASHESVSDIHGFDCQSQVTYPDGQGNYGFAPADAEFIAAARTDIPALLAALASEKERADEWKNAAERLADEAFQRYAGSDTPRLTDLCEDIFRLANYHTATTEP